MEYDTLHSIGCTLHNYGVRGLQVITSFNHVQTLCNPMQPARLLCLRNSAGKNNGVGSHFLPHPRIEPGSPALQADSLPSEPLGKPK